ncbi:MAG: exopolyphosphatase [Motiliproteus sp.]|nr:exopolyphosphatase [Motiliproteus sp.]
MTEQSTPQLAAIDLGSNSFHLTIAREVHGELQLIDRIGDKVQLASGLGKGRILSDEAIQRGLECLELFAQRIDGIPQQAIRVVGTNTLRAAKNRQTFIDQAEQILGVPVEVISGREEARLIYLGVAHSFSDDEERRLVIDIGGGSTEFIIGKQFTPLELESLHMGCVSFTGRFFEDGKLKRRSFQRATNAAHLELLNIRRHYRKLGWAEVVGASGTIKATYRLLNGEEGSKPITLKSLRELRDKLIEFGTISEINLEGIKANRAQVMPGGVAILMAIFEALEIDSMSYSDGALREGLLYDHIGRQQHEDVRERTISALMERYYIDGEHASEVEATVLKALQQTKLDSEQNRNLLSWASRLHETGLAISHSQFQKHGAYLIENSDLMGFNQREQQQLALLVRGHRRKLPMDELTTLKVSPDNKLFNLLLLLRLAVLLQHSRKADQIPDFDLKLKSGKRLTIEFPSDWLEEHPLTLTDLEQEAGYLKAAGIELKFS